MSIVSLTSASTVGSCFGGPGPFLLLLVCAPHEADVQLWLGELLVGFFFVLCLVRLLLFGCFSCVHYVNALGQIVAHYRQLCSCTGRAPWLFSHFLMLRTVPQCMDGRTRGKKRRQAKSKIVTVQESILRICINRCQLLIVHTISC